MKNFFQLNITKKINLNDLELFRLEKSKIAKKKNKILYSIFVFSMISIVIYLTCFFEVVQQNVLSLLLFLVPTIVYYFFFIGIENLEYKIRYQETIFPKLVNLIDKDIRYNVDKEISETEVDKSQFVKSHYRCSSENYLQGNLNHQKFEAAEIKLKRKKIGRGVSFDFRKKTLFHGMFFSIEIDFPENIIIDILPDDVSMFGKFGTVLQRMNSYRHELVKFDNQDFEKKYVVYANNPHYSQNLVDYNFQQFLLLLAKDEKINLFISIRSNKLYCGFNIQKPAFEIDLHQVLDDRTLEKHYQEFQFYFDSVNQIISKLYPKKESKKSSINNLNSFQV